MNPPPGPFNTAALGPFQTKTIDIDIHLATTVDDAVRRFLSLPLPVSRRDIPTPRLFRFSVGVFVKVDHERDWSARPPHQRNEDARLHQLQAASRSARPLIPVFQCCAIDSAHFFVNLFAVPGWPRGWTLSRASGPDRRAVTLPDLLGSERQTLSRFFHTESSSKISFRVHFDHTLIGIMGFPSLAIKTRTDRRGDLGKFRRSKSKDTTEGHDDVNDDVDDDDDDDEVEDNDGDDSDSNIFRTCAIESLAHHYQLAHVIPKRTYLDNFRMMLYEVYRCVTCAPESAPLSAEEEALFAPLKEAATAIFRDWHELREPLVSTQDNNMLPLNAQLHHLFDRDDFYVDIFGERPVWLGDYPMPLALVHAAAAAAGTLPLSGFIASVAQLVRVALFANASATLYQRLATDELKAGITDRASAIVKERRHRPPKPRDDDEDRRGGGPDDHQSPDDDHTPRQNQGPRRSSRSRDSRRLPPRIAAQRVTSDSAQQSAYGETQDAITHDGPDAARTSMQSVPAVQNLHVQDDRSAQAVEIARPRTSAEFRDVIVGAASDDSSGSRRDSLQDSISASSASSVTAATSLGAHDIHQRNSDKVLPLKDDQPNDAPSSVHRLSRSQARGLARSEATLVKGPFSTTTSGQDLDLWWVETGGASRGRTSTAIPADDNGQLNKRQRQTALDVARLAHKLGNTPGNRYEALRRMAQPWASDRDAERLERMCRKHDFEVEQVRRLFNGSSKRKGRDGQDDDVHLPKLTFESLFRSYENATFYTAWPYLFGKEPLRLDGARDATITAESLRAALTPAG